MKLKSLDDFKVDEKVEVLSEAKKINVQGGVGTADISEGGVVIGTADVSEGGKIGTADVSEAG